MVTINNIDLATIRQECAKVLIVDYDKTTINAAIQAIEDWYDDDKLKVSALIDTATSPVVLTNVQKKKIGAWHLFIKHILEKT